MIKLISLRAVKFKQLDDLALAFPERGSVLIQGWNEAGKSTLFECIYFGLFGKALVTEEPNRLDDLIQYQAQRAVVRLAFSTDGATFVVRRTLNRGRPNTAVLDVEYAGGKRETVTNLTNVNRRVVEELRLDGETLLNSCFVEQKKLEKLETMTAPQRRDTLLRLLNLDRLAALEAQYKLTPADDLQLQQLRDRLRLAEVQRALPQATARLAEAEAELRLLAGARLRRQQADLQSVIAAERERQAELRAEEARLSALAEQIERLKNVRELARVCGESLVALEAGDSEIAQVERELAEAQREAQRAPELAAEAERLETLAAGLADVARREQALAERQRKLDRLAAAEEALLAAQAAADDGRGRLEALERELAKTRAQVAEAEAAERAARRAELLRRWLQIREVALINQESERDLNGLREALYVADRQSAHLASERRGRQWAAVVAGAAALLVLALTAGFHGLKAGLGLAGFPLGAALACLCWRFARLAGRAGASLAQSEKSAAALRTEVNRREGEQALAQRTGQDGASLAGIEAELSALGLTPPAGVEQAREFLEDAIEAGRTVSADDAAPESAAGRRPPSAELRQRLGSLEGGRQALLAELRDLLRRIDEEERLPADRQRLAAEVRAEAAELADRRAAMDGGLATEAEAREQAAAARTRLEAARASARKAGSLEEILADRQDRQQRRRLELQASWEQLEGLAPQAEQRVDALRALYRETTTRLTALDEPAVRTAAAETVQQLAASGERVRAAEQQVAESARQLAGLQIEEDRLAAYDALTASEIAGREAALRDERESAFEQVAGLRERQAALEQELDLRGVAVDYGQAVAELAAAEERREVRQQAHRVISLARRNIVAKVLPSTVRNMSLLLPLLTNERYRDVDIDPETYRMKVWDEGARALKAKDIFSGGTRDQFSLALRLAFALATLPEELGTAPGFIFLDEPLSSFDAIRGGALVDLLTRGPVAENFEQIFVISHSRSFDEQLFDYHLQLDGGRIVRSDLPEPEPDSVPSQARLDLAAAAGARA